MSTSTNFMESKIALNFEDSSIFHDRVLIVGEKTFHVASGVLSVWSEYFRGLFSGNFLESDKKEIELKELDADVFETFLRLLYQSHWVSLKVDDLIPLIELSYRFLTPMVLEYCTEYIDKNLDKLGEVGLQLLGTACIHGIEGLKEKLVDHFKNEKELDISTIERLFEIGEEYKMQDLKNNTAVHMEQHLTFENCSDYLDCCEKFNMMELKENFVMTIASWDINNIPPNLIIELSKSAFKHNVESLKKKLRVSVFCLTEYRVNCYNRKRDCQPGKADTTFNWFLQDNHEEIFALPTDIMQFILMSVCKDTM